MLSYRHAFHAGNPADVLKHAVLIFCLEYLLRKDKPLLCVDTHAGAGSYALHETIARRGAALNREWQNGAGRLAAFSADDGRGALPSLLRRYLEICFPSGSCLEYPGSPLLMAQVMRRSDRLVCFELHPADYELCGQALAGRGEVRLADGFDGLAGLLPPPARRALVLIDPPYEEKSDYVRLPCAAAAAIKRFPAGAYLFWYPLLKAPPSSRAGSLPERLLELYSGNRCRVEFYTDSAEHSPRGMYGSGLVIYNPPWTLKAALMEALPVLCATCGAGKDAWKLEWHEI
jgi:23S rRNA (adenine2030-N6)-methyltransferase